MMLLYVLACTLTHALAPPKSGWPRFHPAERVALVGGGLASFCALRGILSSARSGDIGIGLLGLSEVCSALVRIDTVESKVEALVKADSEDLASWRRPALRLLIVRALVIGALGCAIHEVLYSATSYGILVLALADVYQLITDPHFRGAPLIRRALDDTPLHTLGECASVLNLWLASRPVSLVVAAGALMCAGFELTHPSGQGTALLAAARGLRQAIHIIGRS